MKRIALVAVAVAALAGMLTATAAPESNQKSTRSTAPQSAAPRCPNHRHPASENRQLAHRVFALDKWQNPAPGAGAIATTRKLRSCVVDRSVRSAMGETWRESKRRLYLEHAYRRAAPYPGWTDGSEGWGLRWLAVPRYIVECETRGYAGAGRWHALNPSGAQGPAQLLGWGAPYPASTPHEQIAYWRIAREVWESSGPGAWACA